MGSTGTHGLKFSIVITLYNKAPFIKRTLLSVLRQSKPAYEIIVVDDNSSDNSYKIVESVKNNEAREHPSRIKLIRRSQNGGPGAARNTGLEQVSGDYIFLLDGDDEYKPGLFARAEQIFFTYQPSLLFLQFEQDPDGRQLPNIEKLSDILTPLGTSVYKINNVISAYSHDHFGMMGSTVACHWKVLQHGCYQENLNCFEGLDFWYRAARYMESFHGTAILLGDVQVTFHLTKNSVSRQLVCDGGEIYLPCQFEQFSQVADRDVQRLRKRIYTIWMRNAFRKTPDWRQRLGFFWRFKRQIISNQWLNFRYGLR
jgi:glycosyltransferase involved in cell wall biosynthesis